MWCKDMKTGPLHHRPLHACLHRHAGPPPSPLPKHTHTHACTRHATHLPHALSLLRLWCPPQCRAQLLGLGTTERLKSTVLRQGLTDRLLWCTLLVALQSFKADGTRSQAWCWPACTHCQPACKPTSASCLLALLARLPACLLPGMRLVCCPRCTCGVTPLPAGCPAVSARAARCKPRLRSRRSRCGEHSPLAGGTLASDGRPLAFFTDTDKYHLTYCAEATAEAAAAGGQC